MARTLETVDADAKAQRLVSRLSCLEWPEESDLQVTDANGLLEAFVAGADPQGRHFAEPRLLRRLFWWQETDAGLVLQWRDELVARGDMKVLPLGLSSYSNSRVMIAVLQDRRRFRRFSDREPIPDEIRFAVYKRDGYRCLHCWTGAQLSLDHIYPWSLGGSDGIENLQTLCRSCNSSKGAKV